MQFSGAFSTLVCYIIHTLWTIDCLVISKHQKPTGCTFKLLTMGCRLCDQSVLFACLMQQCQKPLKRAGKYAHRTVRPSPPFPSALPLNKLRKETNEECNEPIIPYHTAVSSRVSRSKQFRTINQRVKHLYLFKGTSRANRSYLDLKSRCIQV